MVEPRPSPWVAAVRALRPETLGIGAAPVLVGSALAWADGGFALWPALAALVGALGLQAGANTYNDYADYVRGADRTERLGKPRAVASGWLTPRAALQLTFVVFAVAVLCGMYLIAVGGWPIAAVGIAGLLCAVAYTGGPLPLAYYGVADGFVFVFFGPVAVAGTYYVQTGGVSWPALAAGACLGMPATAVLVVNNLRDREGDAAAGKRTLAVRWGAAVVRHLYAVLMLAPFASVVALIGLRWAPPGWAAAFVALPLALRAVRGVQRDDGRMLNRWLGGTVQTLMLFAAALSVGAVLWP